MEHISKILPKTLPKALKPVSGDRLVIEYKCLICHDTGIIHPVEDGKIDYSRTISCQCQAEVVKKVRQLRYLRYCHLPARTEHMTFGNFKCYGDKNLIEALRICRRLASGDEGVMWLTLLSKSDRGKTHLAVAICRRWLSQGKVARFSVVPEMLDELQDSFDMEGEESFRMKIHLLCNVSLLVLDDIGSGKYTDWRREQIFKIINHRATEGLPLVVTSNNLIDSFFGNSSEGCKLDNFRIASRLQRESWCHVVVIDAKEHRLR